LSLFFPRARKRRRENKCRRRKALKMAAAVAAAVSLTHNHTYCTGLYQNFAVTARSSARNSLPPPRPKRVAKLGIQGGGRFTGFNILPGSSTVFPSAACSSNNSNGESKLILSTGVVCNLMSFDNAGSTSADDDSDDADAASSVFSENDEDYVDCSILEALEVKSGPEGFLIKMRDGCYVKCVHNKLEDRGSFKLPDYAPQPAIVLQTNDGSNLLLPIIVLQLPCTMLLEAVREFHVARPTVYQVMRDMLQLMGYKATLVRVTKRVHEAYYARVYLMKESEGEEEAQEADQESQATTVSLDLRPSDAINLAVRCQIPIQVNRQLAIGDGVRIVTELERLPAPASVRSLHQRLSSSAAASASSSLMDLDRPAETEGECQSEALEFDLLRSMFIAAVEERYIDAAKLRDELADLRSKNRTQTQT
jgi:bifunctional DNase/RNase